MVNETSRINDFQQLALAIVEVAIDNFQMLKYFANLFWIHTPGFFQKEFSRIFSSVFETKFSRLFIVPYCLMFGLDATYLDQFEPDSDDTHYSSYSDFFNRKYKILPEITESIIWPCEGYVCDAGSFAEKRSSFVKGQTLDLNTIFDSNAEVTRDYHFVNIFLHNHNYHRVHSPVSGRIVKIRQIPGDLIFLRPWFYSRSDVTYPAFRNERIVFEIVDTHGAPWFLALVGGFGVGTISVSPSVLANGDVQVGQEIAKFSLGSTVCIASPCKLAAKNYLEKVSVGEKMV